MDGLISYILAKGMYVSTTTGISDIKLDGRDLVFEMSDGKQLRVGMGSVVDGLNGKSLEFDWKGTKLGVRVEGDTSFTYVDLKGKDGIDGINGRDGVDGRDGRDGIDGINGRDGVDGRDGINGREIELSKENGYIRWKYVGDVNWINLMPISDLGVSDGKNLEFNWSGTRLGVRVEGDTSYVYTDLKGDTGKNGTDGRDGRDGREVEFLKENGFIKWRYIGETTWIDLMPISDLGVSDGKNLEFNWSGTRLGVRVEGNTNYSYVDLKGDAGKDGINGKNGTDGADGIDGREVEFIIDNGYLKWRYVGEVNWIELLDLSTLNNSNNTWENF